MTAAALPALFDELSFGGEWRRYQKAAIAAFTQRTDEGRQARAAAAADDGGYETVVRDIWF